MSELGELLELLHTRHGRPISVYLELHDWSGGPGDVAPALTARRESDGALHLAWSGAGLFGTRDAGLRHIWAEWPQRVRVEGWGKHRIQALGVRAPDRWWRWREGEGSSTRRISDETQFEEVPPILAPLILTPLAVAMNVKLEYCGRGQRLGRPVILASGRAFTDGADAGVVREFEFDADYGVMLRRAVFQNGDLVQLTEAARVRFGAAEKCREPFADPRGEPILDLDGGPAGIAERAPRAGPMPVEGPSQGWATFWVNGDRGAGKTVFARELQRHLELRGWKAHLIEPPLYALDSVQRVAVSDIEESRRAADLAMSLVQERTVAIVTGSHSRAGNTFARSAHAERALPFVEILVDTPRSVRVSRLRGDSAVELLAGDDLLEEPGVPDVRVPGVGVAPRDAAAETLALLEQRGADVLAHAAVRRNASNHLTSDAAREVHEPTAQSTARQGAA